MTTDLDRRITAIRADRDRSASELLDAAIQVLRDALAQGVAMKPIARAVAEAQPTMASLWVAAAQAMNAVDDPSRFERFALQVASAPKALARYAISTLLPDEADATPLRLVTLSYSRSVYLVLDALRVHRPLRVACAESRPALEGRRLAEQLARLDVPVTVYGDAAIAQALSAADAVLVGADAVTPEWFLNKTGTRMLAAAAAHHGVPCYVVASREKFVPATVGARLEIRAGAAAEIWDAPPPGVTIRNAYFEPTPLELVSAVISDLGVLGAALVPDACAAASAMITGGGATAFPADQ